MRMNEATWAIKAPFFHSLLRACLRSAGCGASAARGSDWILLIGGLIGSEPERRHSSSDEA
jgi:hypothetical protein